MLSPKLHLESEMAKLASRCSVYRGGPSCGSSTFFALENIVRGRSSRQRRKAERGADILFTKVEEEEARELSAVGQKFASHLPKEPTTHQTLVAQAKAVIAVPTSVKTSLSQ